MSHHRSSAAPRSSPILRAISQFDWRSDYRTGAPRRIAAATPVVAPTGDARRLIGRSFGGAATGRRARIALAAGARRGKSRRP
jgi:hypothetical protein